MSEQNSADSSTGIWVTVAAIITGCLCLLFCASLIGASLMLPVLIKTNITPPDVAGSSTPGPVPSHTFVPMITATLTPGGPALLLDSEYVGMWQYPDRWVWIKITPQGRAFQCRIATDRTVYRSEGVLVEGDQIIWQETWGVDSVKRKGNSIILNGKYGEFEYELTDHEMDSACEPPF